MIEYRRQLDIQKDIVSSKIIENNILTKERDHYMSLNEQAESTITRLQDDLR